MSHRPMPHTEQLPRALYRADQVRKLDRLAIERFGIPGETLMQRAGEAAFDLARRHWPQAWRFLVLAGNGNNAGDGFVFALAAQAAGCEVAVMQVGERERLGGDAKRFADRWARQGGQWLEFGEMPRELDLVVDAMLGTGLQRELRGDYLRAVQAVNAHPAPVLAIDIPTGLHSDLGVVMGSAVRADATLSFIGLKQGMFTADGVDCCGQISFDALAVPAAVYASEVLSARRIDWNKQRGQLPERRRSAHKGHFGHVLVVGGDHGFGGAARLAGEAAARCGAGLVSIATRAAHVPGILAARPELMVHAVDHGYALEPLLAKADVVVLGPGLGTSAWGRELFEQALQTPRRLLLDADALNLLAQREQGTEGLPADRVITPHPGEAARLLGVCNAQVKEDRFATLEMLQRRFGGTVLLKGAGTLISSQGNRPPALCSDGNPGMASGGMGDVLSGVIAALMAQGMASDDAVETGVCLHAAAADRAAESGQRGLLAGDLMASLRALINP